MKFTTAFTLLVLTATVWTQGAMAAKTLSVCCQPPCVEFGCPDCFWMDGDDCGSFAPCDACGDKRNTAEALEMSLGDDLEA